MTEKIISQIYEIQTPAEAEMIIEAGVDRIGSVILSSDGWKNTIIRDTVRLVGSSDSLSSMIPLYSDPDAISRMLDYYRPDIVHFCETLMTGDGRIEGISEIVSMQELIRRRFPEIKIMRSVPVPVSGVNTGLKEVFQGSVIRLAGIFEPLSDLFLTDTLKVSPEGLPGCDQPVTGFVGITGETCDWDIAAGLVETASIPVILAGGMSPDNVFEGICKIVPYGVDSCTLTNAVDPSGRPVRFKKDPEKVRRFVGEIRRAEKELDKIS